jgi:hypothetical protein
MVRWAEGRGMGWNVIIQAHSLPFNLLVTPLSPPHIRIYVGYKNDMSQYSFSLILKTIGFIF